MQNVGLSSNGAQRDSSGPRPGFVMISIGPSPEWAQQAGPGRAHSGLRHARGSDSQGVALG